jgi:hypothetical protein
MGILGCEQTCLRRLLTYLPSHAPTMEASLAALSWSLTSCLASFLGGALPHHGTYTIRREPVAAGQARSVVTGTIFAQSTKQPLKVAVVSFNKTVVTTDTLGRFRWEAPAGSYAIYAGFIGYYRVDLPHFKLRQGEHVELTFWVVEEDRPTIN